MDQNKKKKLKEIGYVIPQTCETCIHSKISPGKDFGVCALISYNHLKHSTDVRDLSIYRGGRCEEFYVLDTTELARLGTFVTYLDRRKFTRNNRHKLKVRY